MRRPRVEILYVDGCYRSERGFAGQPDPDFIRATLTNRPRERGRPPDGGHGLAGTRCGRAGGGRDPSLQTGTGAPLPPQRPGARAPTSGSCDASARVAGRAGRNSAHRPSGSTSSSSRRWRRFVARTSSISSATARSPSPTPFSGVPTAHRVGFPDGQEEFAMCAIDALGIAPMLDQPIEIMSRDPLSNETFHAGLATAVGASWRPDTAAAVARVNDRNADSCDGCCPDLLHQQQKSPTLVGRAPAWTRADDLD
jgi:hypothetical protein